MSVSLPQNTDAPAQTVADFQNEKGRRSRWLALRGVVFGAMVAAGLVAIGSIPRLSMTSLASSPIISLVLIFAVGLLALLWRYPGIALPLAFGSALLFEWMPTTYPDSLTDAVPVFWNINTIFQTYLRINFKALPISPFELILVTAGIFSFLQAVIGRSFKISLGTPVIYVPMLTYAAFVVFGFLNGMAQGGDFKLALQETRAQFYFVLLYFMTLNIVKDRAQVSRMLWTLGVCMVIKAALYTFRRYVTLGGLPLPDQGVGSHEEAFLLNGAFVLALCLTLTGTHEKLQRFLWLLMPLILLGNLATNRRAGTAALAIALPIVLVAVMRSMPHRRKAAASIGIAIAVAFAVYYPVFKNSSGILALPARSIKSQFQPDARDASSNAYREAENKNLMATIRTAPVTGYGYGRRFLHAVEIANISEIYEWWDLLPHNQVLWVWMRVGTGGYMAFWLMWFGIIVHACFTIRRPNLDRMTKAVALNGLLVGIMLLIFGLLDLQLSNMRSMLFGAICVGLVSAVSPRTTLEPMGEEDRLKGGA
ncbi:MAG: O-antigen ligase family protein [Armatimonadetes bacterium]|nr:O-antigen ligase family protein [Armatimonadota bacterium]